MTKPKSIHPATNISTEQVRAAAKRRTFGSNPVLVELSVTLRGLMMGAPMTRYSITGEASEEPLLLEELTSVARGALIRRVQM